MTSLKSNQKYWAEFQVLPDGKLKIVKANKLVKVNQHKARWKLVDSRDFSRALDGRELILR